MIHIILSILIKTYIVILTTLITLINPISRTRSGPISFNHRPPSRPRTNEATPKVAEVLGTGILDKNPSLKKNQIAKKSHSVFFSSPFPPHPPHPKSSAC
ncbi:hypothetical protein BDE02_18G116500 [Populus trichocarpa]|nr:hypothetical protein BDE02_18G116500 [Populus trichocarpa]